MKLEFYNCPEPETIESIKISEIPGFINYKPDFELIKSLQEEYKDFKNILVIGHGGSITSFYGMYNALRAQANKKAYFLSTVDPDYIFELKSKLKTQDTLVIAISKSGETVTQIEMLSQFFDFPLLFIAGKDSPLKTIAEKIGAKIIIHPVIGGRFTGLTEVALIPAAIVGLNVHSLYKGAKNFYDIFAKDNLAFKSASVMYQLEQKGFVDVFMPFYSHGLFSMSNIIVQLCHESFCKNGKGQTYFAHESPESQHHTNQRFFGGQKNICGFFTSTTSAHNNLVAVYPPQLHSVNLKGRELFDINKIPLQAALECELIGTMEDARIQGIPLIHITVSAITEENIGGLLAFWQLYAVYASLLRGVNPFDQPQVENSKKLSFNKRLAYKSLL